MKLEALTMCVQLCPALCNPMGCSPQAPLSMEFFRPEYWSRLPFPIPGDLSDPGIKPTSLVFPALAAEFFTTSASWEAQQLNGIIFNHVLQLYYEIFS